MGWIRPNGSYYEGDQEHALHISVPSRPSLHHQWNGEAWVPELGPLKAAVAAAIDQAAGAARARYITTVPGQEATYLLKERQAEAFTAANYQGAVPALVQAEASATGLTAQQATAAILAERDAWITLAAGIEQIRRAAKLAVANAGNEAAILAARDQAIGTLESV